MYRAKAGVTLPAPLGAVWEFVSEYPNLARFLSHVEEVKRVGDRTWEWRLRVPQGLPVRWTATTTLMDPERELAWQSVGGEISAHGSIGLEPDGEDTQVCVELEYAPPGGTVGKVFATLFNNLQRTLEEDLRTLARLAAEWPKDAGGEGAPRGSATPNPLESELVEKNQQ
jgi:uncharacterized membrane protein